MVWLSDSSAQYLVSHAPLSVLTRCLIVFEMRCVWLSGITSLSHNNVSSTVGSWLCQVHAHVQGISSSWQVELLRTHPYACAVCVREHPKCILALEHARECCALCAKPTDT